ncbi:sensor histidine kinase [Pseudomonas abietaniphila]|uniref:histidine kinase n=1 Tax=Pseudomonas abietaniphila TaxID=89065 RepID=A0A1G8C6N5_9PSED|nr:sensor histidine kinase [Pseudomonas abietaniphila]SDH41196.1 Signal transduction histidine kinase [Pseudomonas abietaniphila]
MAKIKPRARIVRTIGDQLISGPDAALIELVKNAYDADSQSVTIKITPPVSNHQQGEIIVSDQGHGMSYSDLLDKWLEPATTDKVHRKISPTKNRKMLGAKGVGRFATARLGKRLQLFSTTMFDGALESSLMIVDWECFEKVKYLEDVEIDIKKIATEKNTGVRLVINELNDTWTKSRLINLIKELRRIASPIKSQDENFKIYLDLSDFKPSECGFSGEELLVNPFEKNTFDTIQEIIPLTIENLFHYCVEGNFDESGAFRGTFINKRGENIKHELQMPATKLDPDEDPCGRVEVRLNIYDREPDAIQQLFSNLGFGALGRMESRKLLNENIGVGIYRDGFRIRPYGDAETDWLEMERKRVQDPSRKLGLNQLAGIISISDETESGLVERSSREGLEHNGSFLRLKRQISNLLSHVEALRQDFREKAGLSRKKPGGTIDVHNTSALEETAKAISELPDAFRDKVQKAFIKETTALKTAIEDLETYQQALISHSSLGLVITQVLHDGRHFLSHITTRSTELAKDSPRILENSKFGDYIRKNLPGSAQEILNSATDLASLFSALNPVSGKKKVAATKQNITATIHRCIKLFEKELATSNIAVEFSPTREDIFFLGHDGDLMAAVLNLMDNAIHWLSLANIDNRRISIRIEEPEQYIQIIISNNGPTIDAKYIDKLFDAGFTLKQGGSGIGLAIAREALRASKADLAFDDSATETSFIIEMVNAKND